MNSRRGYMHASSRLLPYRRFCLVGMIGFALQVLLIQVFSQLFSNGLFATAAAVEITVLHNFVWHERFTWSARALPGKWNRLLRLARFHASNGAISIIGNVALMRLFTGTLKLPLLIASLLSVSVCSFANFIALDGWVFGSGSGDASEKLRVGWDGLPSREVFVQKTEHK